MKIAKVIPIFKQSDPKQLNNYRPISLLPAFSKVLEKVIFNRMTTYLNSQNLLFDHQYGFRPKHGTIHPILHLLNSCAESNNKHPKELLLSVFCDLSKAFDVISHDIMLKKLEHLGFRGVILDWIQNYLTDRLQYVEIDNIKSNVCQIQCGVPQGSILGPLHYLIYVNDIKHATSGNILSFADDTSLFLSDSDVSSLFRRSNIEVNNLFNWFCANKLCLNPTKTKYIVIKPNNHICHYDNLSIMINGTKLSQIGNQFDEQSTTFLGVYIDESLSWKHHINHINKKISRALFCIKQVKNFLPTNTLKILYYCRINPYLTYGILAWGNAPKSILRRTELIHKRAIRTMTRANFNSHTEPLFKQMHILKIQDQYEYEAALFMTKFTLNKLPSSFNNVFTFNHEIKDNRETRQSSLLHIRRCDSTFSKKLPLYDFPVIWNKWSSSLPMNPTVIQAKKQTRASLLSQYADKVKCQNSRCFECKKTWLSVSMTWSYYSYK